MLHTIDPRPAQKSCAFIQAGCTNPQVVGGADKGGIIVREDLDLNSPALSERLATGAQVKDLKGPFGMFGVFVHADSIFIASTFVVT